MSHKMSHLQIIGLKFDLEATIHTLGELGCIHIDDVSETPELSITPLTIDAAMVRRQEELSLKLLQVNGIIDILCLNKKLAVESLPHDDASDECLLAEVSDLVPRVQALANRREKLHAEQELLPRFLDTLHKLMPLFLSLARDPSYVSFGLLVNRDHMEVLDTIAYHVDSITEGRAQTVVGLVDSATQAMLISAPRMYMGAVSTMLDRHDVSRLRLPPEFDSESPDAAIASLYSRLNAIPADDTAITRELNGIAKEWASRLRGCRAMLQNDLQIYDVLPRLGQTEMTFVLAGWVPVPDVPRLQATLRDQFGDRLFVYEVPLTDALKKRAPVALTNPGVARPFESLVHLFNTPRYGEIDPTSLMALFMPIFFGMMLGDIGYGVLLLGFMLWLRRRFRAPGIARDITTILVMGAGWAIVFGVLFGELFGTMGEQIGLHPVLFDRTSSDHLIDLLALTVAAGAAHILLGLILGLWQGFKEKDKHHLLERGGRLLGLIALFMLTGILVDFLPNGFMTPAIALLTVGTVFLAWSLGKIGVIIAPIEMIGLVGNVLSYLRIAAIGLSSVYLALVASEIAGMVGSIVIGVIIAVLLHALNLVLGTFSPTIQSLRLHYVEFFRNFYQGGGRLYQPYRLRIPQRE